MALQSELALVQRVEGVEALQQGGVGVVHGRVERVVDGERQVVLCTSVNRCTPTPNVAELDQCALQCRAVPELRRKPVRCELKSVTNGC